MDLYLLVSFKPEKMRQLGREYQDSDRHILLVLCVLDAFCVSLSLCTSKTCPPRSSWCLLTNSNRSRRPARSSRPCVQMGIFLWGRLSDSVSLDENDSMTIQLGYALVESVKLANGVLLSVTVSDDLIQRYWESTLHRYWGIARLSPGGEPNAKLQRISTRTTWASRARTCKTCSTSRAPTLSPKQ